MPTTTQSFCTLCKGIPAERRRARYRCALVFVRGAEDSAPLIAEGVWQGLMLEAPLGAGGFGYDPYFWLPERGLTAAQLDMAEKNRLSHRGIAMRALLDAAGGARTGQRPGARCSHERAAAFLVRAHALVRAQMSVLRFQFASIEVGRA